MTSTRLLSRSPDALGPPLWMSLLFVWNRVRSGNGVKVVDPKIDQLLNKLFKAEQKQPVLNALHEEISLRQIKAESRICEAWEKARGKEKQD